MKNARIMLSAIALFAIVGGAFAFKAHENLTVFPQQLDGKCTVASLGDVDAAQPLVTYNTVSSSSCPFQDHYLIGE